ncbi:spore germination protein [Bacillus marinisedimentorum]|uniref:spore germination protein n=1 Tax=Bacillus marinisedimentorum TaxID=1821260 RepID=UPI0009F29E69|nr:spore germination protein [Bacillus marinisedimentorum]
MFSFLKKKKGDKINPKNEFAFRDYPYQADSVPEKQSTGSLEANIDFIQSSLNYTQDFKRRDLDFNGLPCTVLYLDTLVDLDAIEKFIITPLLEKKSGDLKDILPAPHLEMENDLSKAVNMMVGGAAVLLMEGIETFAIIKHHKPQDRSIQEPGNEYIVRGSHLGFNENMNTNINMLRKMSNNPNLTVEYLNVGKSTRVRIAIVYLNHLMNKSLLNDIKKRVRSISTDFIQTPGFIEEYIEDRPFSPFPQLLKTERPDRVIANIMDGKAALLLDNSPSALIAPSTFINFYQSPDDYNSRWYIGSFYRLVRLVSFFISIGLPALYIAVISYHYEIIPTELMFTIKSSLEPIPLPPILEAMAMQLILELIREATIRLPRPIAQTIGIVGGLVIGNAIVDANLVSNMMVIVVALTAIASFIVPSNEMSTAVRLLGFPLMLLAAVFGLIGIAFGLMFLLIHLCKLEVFGTPYLTPFGPLRGVGMKDTVVRLPIWLLDNRPVDARPVFRLQESSSRQWDDKE